MFTNFFLIASLLTDVGNVIFFPRESLDTPTSLVKFQNERINLNFITYITWNIIIL